jgi:bifunctional NMN adenylyltransferase/nudix hydrolase
MTSKKQYDHLVFIGRFQPFHLGHQHVIKTALELADNVIVLVGSANTSRNSRNPFTFEEREYMIHSSFRKEYTDGRLTILPLNDYTYSDGEWVSAVQKIVNEHLRSQYPNQTYEQVMAMNELKVSLIGHNKDNSSYYLKMFPTWGHIDVAGIHGNTQKILSATDVRNLYFSAQWHDMSWTKIISNEIHNFLKDWIVTSPVEYQNIVNEYKFVADYKKQWANSPYAPTFVTVDGVVVQSGHILLVRRGAMPGKGKLALPGGFVEQDETLITGVLRELKEETRLKVPEPVLRGSLKKQKTFDDPNRSSRGRTITTAFLFHLFPQTELPKVKGGDDAKDAFWVPISELKAEDMFEDHYHIIRNLTADL